MAQLSATEKQARSDRIKKDAMNEPWVDPEHLPVVAIKAGSKIRYLNFSLPWDQTLQHAKILYFRDPDDPSPSPFVTEPPSHGLNMDTDIEVFLPDRGCWCEGRPLKFYKLDRTGPSVVPTVQPVVLRYLAVKARIAILEDELV